MKILVIGSGGREHALTWKITQSPQVSQVFIAPGNPGTASEPRCQNVAIAADDVAGGAFIPPAKRGAAKASAAKNDVIAYCIENSWIERFPRRAA